MSNATTETPSALRRSLLALPDAVSCGSFLLLWIAPLQFGAHGVRNGMLLMLVEFVLIHSGAVLGSLLHTPGTSHRIKLLSLLGFGLFYSLFIAAFAFSFGAWWPVLAFSWLLLGKLTRVFEPTYGAGRSGPAQSDWALSMLFYLGAVLTSLLLPLPRLGISAELQPLLEIPGTGAWVDRPHSVIAFGALYFGLQAWSKWKQWQLPNQKKPPASVSGD